MLCGPESVCHDRDSSSPDEWNLKNLLHAGNCSRGIGIEALYLGTEHRGMRHQRDLHPGKIHVKAKLLRAIALRATIKPAHLLIGKPKIALLLKLNIFRHRQMRCGFRQLCVSCRLAIWPVHDAGLGAALRGRYLPLRGGGSNQHGARSGAELAILLKGVRNRTGAAHHLNAIHRVAIDIAGRGEFGDHLQPVSIHLVCQQHGQCSLYTLAEFQPVHLDHDLAVRPHVNEGIRRIDLGRGRLLSNGGPIKIERYQQPSCRSRRDPQECSPAD